MGVLGLVAFMMSQAAPPVIIAHRGASGYRPEHTLESYRVAIAQGADVIEPDLVMTRDRILVARHENEIGATTDAARKFPDRQRTKLIDGKPTTGWFVEDFTLAEIKTLRARERLEFRSHRFDGRFEVPTFEEILGLIRREERRLGRRIGVYPETKHPTYHESLGLPITDSLLAVLARHGYRGPADPVWVQSFESGNLRAARGLTKLRLVFLIEAAGPETTPAGLGEIATFADGIGPSKDLIQPIGPDGRLDPPTSLVADAHAAGLFVHAWTLRADSVFLPKGYRGDPEAEVRRMVELGVDGFFTDFPDLARRVISARAGRGPRPLPQ